MDSTWPKLVRQDQVPVDHVEVLQTHHQESRVRTARVLGVAGDVHDRRRLVARCGLHSPVEDDSREVAAHARQRVCERIQGIQAGADLVGGVAEQLLGASIESLQLEALFFDAQLVERHETELDVALVEDVVWQREGGGPPAPLEWVVRCVHWPWTCFRSPPLVRLPLGSPAIIPQQVLPRRAERRLHHCLETGGAVLGQRQDRLDWDHDHVRVELKTGRIRRERGLPVRAELRRGHRRNQLANANAVNFPRHAGGLLAGRNPSSVRGGPAVQ